MASARNFFSDEQHKRIVQAIRDAEHATSGEIRVHLENNSKPDALARAQQLFVSLGMHNTADHNGVLLFLAVKDRQFAIIGDSGIDAAVPADFWDSVRNVMQAQFKAGKFSEGLCEGIKLSGEKLKQFFPYHEGDTNELSDDISFDDED